MAASIDPQVRLDLANETLRNYGEIKPDFPQKMARRLKRKFRCSLDAAEILSQAQYFKEIYKSGSSIIWNFIAPNGEYARLENIRLADFETALAEKYPDEDKAIIKTACDWLIYYEYLR
ncbi:MAG TPA: hypothetical protein VHP14_26450 [Anaerolineales bacterium]|nr:hypothetical protein [Anaerolineales bacterium]